MTEFIAVYSQSCIEAGHVCNNVVEITEDGQALNEDDSENTDVVVYEVTAEMATILEGQSRRAGAGPDLYFMRVAREIRARL